MISVAYVNIQNIYLVVYCLHLSGQGISFTGQVLPGSDKYSPVAAATGSSYRMRGPRMPAAMPYGNHFQMDSQLSLPVECSWNSYDGDYEDTGTKIGTRLTERWSFDFCN